jgi:hypothetical protein
MHPFFEVIETADIIHKTRTQVAPPVEEESVPRLTREAGYRFLSDIQRTAAAAPWALPG